MPPGERPERLCDAERPERLFDAALRRLTSGTLVVCPLAACTGAPRGMTLECT